MADVMDWLAGSAFDLDDAALALHVASVQPNPNAPLVRVVVMVEYAKGF